MKFVRSGLGHQGDLCSRTTSGVRIRTGGRDAELLRGIECRPQNSREGVAVLLVIVVQAIQGYVRLVGACAGDRTATAILVRLCSGLPSKIQNPRLQAQQIGHVAPFHRQRLNRGVIDRVPDRRVRRIQRFRFAAHVDRGGCGLDAQFEVNRGRLVHQKIGLLGLRAETGTVGGDDISSWRNLLEPVFAASICRLSRFQARGLVHDGHLAAGDQRAGRVGNRPSQGGKRCLRPGKTATTNHEKHGC